MLAQIFSEKLVLILAAIIGMAICSVGIGQVAARGEWMHPLSIVAYVLGALILLIVIAALLGIPLPVIDGPRTAFVAVVVLAVAKVALSQLHRMFA